MNRSALAELGALLADETRAQLLMTLLDGKSYSVSELARHVGVAPSTTSEHLARLSDAGIVCAQAQGRHRYFRLHGSEVAQMLEPLLGFLPPSVPLSVRPRASSALLVARRCYDHLAGAVAVQIYDQLLLSGRIEVIDHRPILTEDGTRFFSSLGITIDELAKKQRPMLRTCLDWTERRTHLAGSIGAQLLETMLTSQWFKDGAVPRALVLTSAGRDGLSQFFGLSSA